MNKTIKALYLKFFEKKRPFFYSCIEGTFNLHEEYIQLYLNTFGSWYGKSGKIN